MGILLLTIMQNFMMRFIFQAEPISAACASNDIYYTLHSYGIWEEQWVIADDTANEIWVIQNLQENHSLQQIILMEKINAHQTYASTALIKFCVFGNTCAMFRMKIGQNTIIFMSWRPELIVHFVITNFDPFAISSSWFGFPPLHPDHFRLPLNLCARPHHHHHLRQWYINKAISRNDSIIFFITLMYFVLYVTYVEWQMKATSWATCYTHEHTTTRKRFETQIPNAKTRLIRLPHKSRFLTALSSSLWPDCVFVRRGAKSFGSHARYTKPKPCANIQQILIVCVRCAWHDLEWMFAQYMVAFRCLAYFVPTTIYQHCCCLRKAFAKTGKFARIMNDIYGKQCVCPIILRIADAASDAIRLHTGDTYQYDIGEVNN